MAAKKDDDDNPFSFKSFVSGKEKRAPTQKQNIDVNDIFDLGADLDGDATKPSSQKPAKPHDNSASGGTKNATKKSKPKENPFSFKKFLSGPNSGASSHDTVPTPSSSESSAQYPARNGISKSSASHLPGMWEDSLSPSLHDTLSVDLLGESSILNGSPVHRGSPSHHPSNQDDLFVESDDELDSAGGIISAAGAAAFPGSTISVLPDFLSDGAALSAGAKKAPASSASSHEDLLSQLRMLKDENAQLKRELASEKQNSSNANQRLTQLKQDFEQRKKKEAEETKVMEKAVLQVEENLVTTTQRAIQAETTNKKLKQELKALQNQVKVLSAENQAYRSGDGGLADIRERTKYTAQQLQSAAVVAEKNLKELSSGVDQLKLLSQVLSSLEKISEVTTDDQKESEAKGS